MYKNSKAAKDIRRKSAISRLENNISAYQQTMTVTKDQEILKKLQNKIKAHKLTIENTNNNLKQY
tara:strand:- start:338 stop:532 length:195 start_codon:yes stop_codon:yes gene_type:complete